MPYRGKGHGSEKPERYVKQRGPGRKAVWVINVTYKTIAPVRVTKKLPRLETTEQGHVIFRPCQPEIETGPNHFKVDESPG